MADDKSLKDNITLLEKELVTVAERLGRPIRELKDTADAKLALNGPKLFIGQVHPHFKSEFPDIVPDIDS